MKSATITWITYNNYGTELQAYALQQYLEELGLENHIISDDAFLREKHREENAVEETQSITFDIKRRFLFLLKKYCIHPGKLLQTAASAARIKSDYRFSEKNNIKFASFKKNRLRIDYGYSSHNLDALNQNYDLFFCGSDQVWSVLDYNFDGFYYLDFVRKKKISYAASVGTDIISDEKAGQIRKWLADYTAVSVRESSTAGILSQITSKNVAWVCDPTLLYDASFWGKLAETSRPGRRKYLLCYFLSDNSWYFEYAKAVAKYKKLKLLLLPSRNSYRHKEGCCKESVGPEEFVSYVKNADFVLTDSYHGSIFAMQFNKNFLYLKRFLDTDSASQNIRVFSLFERLNILDTIISPKSFEPNDIVEIPYDRVNASLSEFREYSRNFLRNAVNP